jgi:3-methyladenine DNA glycosylase AlkD
MIENIKKDFKKVASKKRADHSARFFKTGKGQYSEGDLFLGVSNPEVYKISNKYKNDISIKDVTYFLQHKVHAYRLFALDILKYMYKRGNEAKKKEIVDMYLDNREYVNNWDLVDLSAPHILGNWLLDRDRDILYKLVNEQSLWSKRIAIISTLSFVKNNDFKDTLKISKILLSHDHDLIHKAVGWMLREIWKRDKKVAEKFLKTEYENIPRTTLRYAIERMEEKKRQRFLKGKF